MRQYLGTNKDENKSKEKEKQSCTSVGDSLNTPARGWLQVLPDHTNLPIRSQVKI